MCGLFCISIGQASLHQCGNLCVFPGRLTSPSALSSNILARTRKILSSSLCRLPLSPFPGRDLTFCQIMDCIAKAVPQSCFSCSFMAILEQGFTWWLWNLGTWGAQALLRNNLSVCTQALCQEVFSVWERVQGWMGVEGKKAVRLTYV